MKPLKASIAFLFLAFSFMLQAQERYSSVKIYPPQQLQQRAELMAMLRIDHFFENDGYIQAEISASDLVRLRETGYAFEIVVPDVAADVAEKNRQYNEARQRGLINIDGSPVQDAGRTAFDQTANTVGNIIVTPAAFQVQATLGGYYSFAQMNAAMDALVTSYPGLVTKTSLGLSVEGRNIWCIKISDNAASDEAGEPEVLFIGLQHAREAIGGASMIFMMQYLCERYALDDKVKDLVDNREIYIIPCMNPDGWEYNRSTNASGGGMWRKNRKVIAAGQYGVDLNRNWSIDWSDCAGASASCGDGTISSANETYWGASAFSEPETEAIRAFTKTRNFVAMIDQHAYGPYYSLPFGRPSRHTGADSLTLMDQRFYVHVPALMGKYNGMRAGNSIQSVGYEVAGGVKDWMLKGEIGVGTKGKIYGMTGEGGYGAAAVTFWPPSAQIVNLCKGMVFQNLQLLYAAGSYVDIKDMTDIALNDKAGNLSFKIKRIGLSDQPVTVSIVPLTNVAAVGTAVTINTLPNYYDTYTGNISYTLPGALTDGQKLRFAWKVETGGITYYDTVTKFYRPTALFTDDMETGAVGTRWVVSAGWNYVADSGYAATRALTESPGTKYPASITTARTARYNGTLNLFDATAAFLTFQTRHKAENFRDKVQVQVSPNGSTWTAIAGKTTVQEPGTLEGSTINGQPSLTGIKDDWVNEVFDLSAYNGQAALQLRFAFTSNATSSFYAAEDEGFYIDNLKVIKSNVAFVVLAVDFISFTGSLQQSGDIQLNWEAVTDNEHSYFEVERSENGSNFYRIGRVNKDQAMQFLDQQPLSGNNYYRIKAVAVNGEVKFSRVILIQNLQARLMSLYPNPANNLLQVQLRTSASQAVKIQVVDLSGREVLTKNAVINGGSSLVNLDITTLPSQVYMLKVLDAGNKLMSADKFIKQ